MTLIKVHRDPEPEQKQGGLYWLYAHVILWCVLILMVLLGG